MNESEGLRLNQMGIAVWLFDRMALDGIRLRESPDLGGLSAGKSYVLKEQAKVFLKMFPDPLLRKYFCTVGSGQGIVVRSGPANYEVSRFLRKAIEVVPAPAEELTDEIAECYVMKLVRVANLLRGQRRSGKSRG